MNDRKQIIRIMADGDIGHLLSGADENTLASKLFRRFNVLAADPDNEREWEEVEKYIESRLKKVLEILSEYQEKKVHPEAMEVHENLLDIFQLYCQDLTTLRDTFHVLRAAEGDKDMEEPELLIRQLEWISENDRRLRELDVRMRTLLVKHPFDFLL